MCGITYFGYGRVVLLALCISLCCSVNDLFAAEVNLSWDPNTETDLAGHKLYRGESSGNYDSVIDVGNTTNYTSTGLVEGKTYYYALTAYDTSDNESGYSKEISYTVPNLPLIKIPTGFTVTNDLVLRWYKFRDTTVVGYKIHYGTESGNLTETVDVPGRDNTSKKLDLTPGTYYFRVSAYNIEGVESPLSAEIKKEVALGTVDGVKVIE
jgi:fibronectin type 3 domain-containing protein